MSKCKKLSVDTPIRSLSKPVPKSTHWYLEPIGEFTNNSLAGMLEEERCSDGVLCIDGKRHNFWSVTFKEVDYLEESCKTEKLLRFNIWYKDKKTGEVKLYKNDRSCAHAKPKSSLRNSLKNGDGKPVKFPHKRKKPRKMLR